MRRTLCPLFPKTSHSTCKTGVLVVKGIPGGTHLGTYPGATPWCNKLDINRQQSRLNCRFAVFHSKDSTVTKLTYKTAIIFFLFYKGESKPFDEVVKHFGDPQGFGQPPITCMRQVGASYIVGQLNTGYRRPGLDIQAKCNLCTQSS